MKTAVLDPQSPEAIEQLAARMAEEFPKLNAVLNNAGIMLILETQPNAREVLVKRVLPLRFAAEQGYEKYIEQFHTFNDRFGAGHLG